MRLVFNTEREESKVRNFGNVQNGRKQLLASSAPPPNDTFSLQQFFTFSPQNSLSPQTLLSFPPSQ